MEFSCRRYVIGTLELLVAENYMIVYLNGATSRKKMPTVGWLRKCYQQIDRRWVSVVVFTIYIKNRCVAQQLLATLSAQVKKELEVFDNRPSFLVYSHPAGNHKTFHKVTSVCKVIGILRYRSSRLTFRSWHFMPLLFTAPNSVRKSSMCTAWQTLQSWFRWSMCPYQIVSNSKCAPLKPISTSQAFEVRQKSFEKTK